ncbi:MAG TPA: alpha/beta hydrolase [Thermoanaerobaculia bacterium]|jgi:pimeloyl-ACP methyl ester carboxylesterase|nr:alpha/beta hydrolase [Thermoanaerobaculia bacterium]
MRKIALIVLGVLVPFLLLLNMLDGFVRQSIYPAPPVRVPPAPAPLEEVGFDLGTGERIVAWAHADPALPPGRPAVAFFHGNGENLETMRMSGTFDELARLRVAWIAVDYPGYGRSTGSPSEEGSMAAAAAAVAWLRERHPGRPLVLCGWSLGAATAIGTAARHPERAEHIRGLIALSPWTSLPDTARIHFPGFMVQSMLREKYDSLAAAKKIGVPALVIHGEVDNLIPAAQGKEVAAALSARWVPVPSAGHNDLLARDEVWMEMERFLDGLAE